MSENGWVVIKDKKIILGPFGWNSAYLNSEFKKLNICISFPSQEPKEGFTLKEGINIWPVTKTVSEFDSSSHVIDYSSPTITVDAKTNTVNYRYDPIVKPQEIVDAEIEEQEKEQSRIDLISLKLALQEVKDLEMLNKVVSDLLIFLEQRGIS